MSFVIYDSDRKIIDQSNDKSESKLPSDANGQVPPEYWEEPRLEIRIPEERGKNLPPEAIIDFDVEKIGNIGSIRKDIKDKFLN